MKTHFSRGYTVSSFFLIALFWLGGCMANTGTVTHADVAHFAFMGNTQGAIVTIDDQPGVTLDGDNAPHKIASEPGRHRIRVLVGEKLVIDREVLVGDQQTMEISIP